MNCDLIIIGAGPGGYRAAEYAAKKGLKVVIFEDAEVGGTCLNVGCIPTKTYVHSATFEEARERMAQVVSQLRQGVETILSHPNITLVREKAVFGKTPLLLEGVGEAPIIIATGSETKWLPHLSPLTSQFSPLNSQLVVDSTGLLNLDTLPKRLCIIGAGVIGMEFASVFNRFGSEVTVIEYLKECLPALDSDIAKRLRKTLEKRGITFKMKTAVQSLADIDADVILMATGRKPRTEGLNLEALGVTLAPNGAIPVDDHFRVVTVPDGPPSGVYAIGDVNGLQMLAHAAEFQAKHVVDHILHSSDAVANSTLYTLHSTLNSHLSSGIVPAAIFTEPEAACVGPTEDQLKAQGIPYECRKAFWRANGKALAMNETDGMLKLFTTPLSPPSPPSPPSPLTSNPSSNETPGLILGCHAYGAHAADIVQEVSVLMCMGATLEQLRHMVHIHPTLSEILLTAAEQ